MSGKEGVCYERKNCLGPRLDIVAKVSWVDVGGILEVSWIWKLRWWNYALLASGTFVYEHCEEGGDHLGSVWWWGWSEHRQLNLGGLSHV